MRLLIAISLLLSCLAAPLPAQRPIHGIQLSNGASFEIVSEQKSFGVFPLSERMQQAMRNGRRKTILGADYASTGIEVGTKDPKGAITELLQQIAEQTKRPLGVFINTSTEKLAPSAILMAADQKSVWFLTLTPKPHPPSLAQLPVSHVYTFTCTYLIDDSDSGESLNHVAQIIACDEKDDGAIGDAFNAYHQLLSTKKLKAAGLMLPAHLTKKSGDTLVFDRAFYISPNELRGFTLIIPADCLEQKNGLWISAKALRVETEQTRQGITSLLLKAD